MSAPDTAKLAEKIAKLIEGEPHPPQAAILLAAIEKINHRLDKLETAARLAESSSIVTTHPSLDKFTVAEAVYDKVFDGVKKEKACQFEPDKPCDHCSMCNSRGF